MTTERALRRLFGVGEPLPASGDPRRLAAELSRTIGDAPDGGETELLGWIVAALERAHAGAIGENAVRVVAALLEEHRRLVTAQRARRRTSVACCCTSRRPTRHSCSVRRGSMSCDTWTTWSRRELLARALAWVARGYANGRFTDRRVRGCLRRRRRRRRHDR